MRRAGIPLVTIFCLLMLSTISVAVPFSIAGPRDMVQVASASGLDYVVVIMMENHSNSSILGSTSSATFMKHLAYNYSLAESYTAITHPSLPNYLAIVSGSTFGCTTDLNPNSTGCTRAAWSSQNLVDRLGTSGRTWKAYMEDMPNNCYLKDYARYYVHHNPFAYFGDIVTNPIRCNRIAPAGIGDSALVSDLNSVTTASNFMWLTPNGCNDMHDNNCGGSSISIGDNYLKGLVPQILSSPVFKTQKAALFITFDEGTQNINDYVYATWAGRIVDNNYRSISSYDHYSFLSTLETFWGLDTLSGGDVRAKPMIEFFSSPPPPMPLRTGFTYSPLTPLIGHEVTFSATASGGTAPYGFSWTFNASSIVNNQTVKHTFLKAGAYNVTVRVKDAVDTIATASKIIDVTSIPLPLRVSFTFSPTYPSVDDNVTLTGQVIGGIAPYTYQWNFGGNTIFQGQTVVHMFSVSGSYRVVLTVADGGRMTKSTFQLVNVTATQFLSSSFSYTPSSPFQLANVTFTASTVGGDQPYTYSWNLGDGSIVTGQTVHHVYHKPGSFNVILTTIDSDMTTVTTSRTVTVTRTAQPIEETSCWYCLWSALHLSLPLMLLAIVSGAIVVSGVVFVTRKNRSISLESRKLLVPRKKRERSSHLSTRQQQT